ncbi:MAG TPA: LamG-like jellyroll fold domain-containing protein [Planctomycetota bacterium]|nr:LamG-like jellyroll fold domain-containing protein [Planctomycetota bacterium]
MAGHRSSCRRVGGFVAAMAAAILLCLAVAFNASAAVINWTGAAAGDNNWGTAGNWSGTPTPPGTADSALFTSTGAAPAAGTTTNVVNSTRSIAGIEYQNTTGNYHTTDLGGNTLTVTGEVGEVRVNRNRGTDVHAAFKNGNLTIGTTTRVNLYLGLRTANPSTAGQLGGFLDLTEVGTFNAYLATLGIGTVTGGSTQDWPRGELYLAQNNVINATSILIANSTSVGLGNYNNLLELGRTNTLNVSSLTVAGAKGIATMEFNLADFSDPSLNSVTIRGTSGGISRLGTFRIGYNSASGTGTAARGTVDLRGGSVDARVTNLVVGYKAADTNTGDGFGFLKIGAGTFDATSVILGQTASGTDGDNQGEGTLELYGGQFIAGTITLGQRGGTGAAKGTILLDGGTLTANTIQRGGGTGVFTWNGGTLHVGTFGASASNMNLANTGTGTLAPGTSIGTTDIWGTYTQGSSARLEIEIADLTTFDLLTVHGAATLAGYLDVSLLSPYTPTIGDLFDVLMANSITATGLSLSGPDGPAFAYSLVAVAGGEALQLEYTGVIPEPATLLLLGGGLVALARRRRRRAGRGSTVRGGARGLVALLGLLLLLAPTQARAGLVGYWNFDGTVADQSPNGHDGALPSGVAYQPDYPAAIGSGQCLDFTGTTNYVNVPTLEHYFEGGSAITFSAWVKSNATGQDRGFFGGRVSEGTNQDWWGVRYDSAGADGGGTNVIKAGLTIGGTAYTYESASGVQTTSWQHVVMVWESGQPFKLYIGGALDTPVPAGNKFGTVVGSLSNQPDFALGTGAKNPWEGRMDDVSVYNQALTPAQVAALASGTSPLNVLGPTPPPPPTEVLEFSPAADSYVRRSTPDQNYGGDNSILLKDANDGYCRKGYIRFDLPAIEAGDLLDAEIEFFVNRNDSSGGPRAFTLNVYGLIDGYTGTGNLAEDWGETLITWANAPANVETGLGFEAANVYAGVVLGTISVPAQDPSTPYSIILTNAATAGALVDFLKTDTNGMVSLLLSRTSSDTSYNFGLASRETDSGALLRLTVESAFIPEPCTLLLLGGGLVALARRRRTRARRSGVADR